MKHLVQTISTGIIFLAISFSLSAQNVSSGDKLLVDNEHITAIEVTFEPGKKTPVHTHPAHFIYALTGGKIEVTSENGEIQTYELNKGDSAFFPPEGPHSTVNTGKESIKILLIEFKDQPYMPDTKMK